MSTKYKILITCPPMIGMKEHIAHMFDKKNVEYYIPDMVQTLSEEKLKSLVPDYDGWIIGDDPATREVFRAGSKGKLKAAVKWGVGVDNVDFQACKDYNIAIANTPNMFGAEVADIAVAYVIGLARDLFYIDREVRQNHWPKNRGISLAGKRAGIIGYGDIGINLAKRLTVLGMKLLVYVRDSDYLSYKDEYEFMKWPDRVDECDFLVFTCSLNNENYHMLDETVLSLVKKNVRIVNVARGALIDEPALVRALQTGQVESVALDVFEEEPLPVSSPLRDMDCCIFGSHNSSNTTEAVTATNKRVVNKLFGFLGIS